MASAVSLRVDYSAAELQRLAAVLVDAAHPAPEDRKVALRRCSYARRPGLTLCGRERRSYG